MFVVDKGSTVGRRVPPVFKCHFGSMVVVVGLEFEDKDFFIFSFFHPLWIHSSQPNQCIHSFKHNKNRTCLARTNFAVIFCLGVTRSMWLSCGGKIWTLDFKDRIQTKEDGTANTLNISMSCVQCDALQKVSLNSITPSRQFHIDGQLGAGDLNFLCARNLHCDEHSAFIPHVLAITDSHFVIFRVEAAAAQLVPTSTATKHIDLVLPLDDTWLLTPTSFIIRSHTSQWYISTPLPSSKDSNRPKCPTLALVPIAGGSSILLSPITRSCECCEGHQLQPSTNASLSLNDVPHEYVIVPGNARSAAGVEWILICAGSGLRLEVLEPSHGTVNDSIASTSVLSQSKGEHESLSPIHEGHTNDLTASQPPH
jgi:hypothetical protein